MGNLPEGIIAKLITKMSTQDWIATYERVYKK